MAAGLRAALETPPHCGPEAPLLTCHLVHKPAFANKLNPAWDGAILGAAAIAICPGWLLAPGPGESLA